ncbi:MULTISPECIES: hypothetical protein [unclassified Streptomyces]|uniref:hypothetical protein n=1 Tax=unclassified Streptomyces TaxID=2593676 RepID=UPI0036656DF9
MGADPGSSLAPAAPPSGGAARGESEEAAGSRPDTSSGTGSGTASGTTSEAGAVAGAATSGAASRQQAEPETEGRGRLRVRGRGQAASSAVPDTAAAAGAGTAASASVGASAGVAAAAAAGGGRASGEGAARGEDEPPSGNPKKPLLAAAGIAGAVLLVVPLLIWATDDSGQKKDKTSVAADSDTVLDGESLGAPQGEYAPAEPSAGPSGKPSKSAEAKGKTKGKAKTNGEAQAPVGADMPDYKAAVPPGDPKKPAKEKSSTGTNTNSGSTQRQAAGPPAGTAAYSVLQLADRNPGRHVCYRAYVQDIGWQSVRCDGATAGTEGQGRPIKALNIAVSGMTSANGTAATPFIQGTGWAGTNWKGAANGVNLTIGTASNSAPNMAGFGVSVDSAKSQICQNAHVKDGGWLGVQCDTPASKNNYIFGGTLDKARWLEAVRFTV